MEISKRFVVIGGGAAGFFAALNAKQKSPHLDVVILEATPRLLTKVKISGGGRCNVTHNCFDVATLVKNYPRGFRELRGAFSRFQPQDTISWFAKRGVRLVAESDGRMFPSTNSSQTIIDCFLEMAKEIGVEIRKSTIVKAITPTSPGFRLDLGKQGQIEADWVLMATGSAPLGHQLIGALGHRVTDLAPSLFTFNIRDPLLEELQGVSFPEVSLKLTQGKKSWEQVGPLLITHWGLSGPAVLKLSAFAARELLKSNYQATLRVNLIQKNEEACYQELQSFRQANLTKKIQKDAMFGLTRRFWHRLVDLVELGEKTWADASNKSLRHISQKLCQSKLEINGKGVFKEEFVTCGGVSLKEVDFRTMASKLVPGLYFAGEVLDIDGITGGFNFQNAWTGGWICSEAVALNSGPQK